MMQIILAQYDQIASLKGCIVSLVEFLQLFSRVGFHICPQVTNTRRCVFNTHVDGDYDCVCDGRGHGHDDDENDNDDDDGDNAMMTGLEKNQNLRKLFNSLPRVQREQI